MFYGYCFADSISKWMPKVQLENAADVFSYCRLHHILFKEVRITDEDDFCVARVVNHVLYVPLNNRLFSMLDLDSGVQGTMTRDEMEQVDGTSSTNL